jgi:hypothetical protein
MPLIAQIAQAVTDELNASGVLPGVTVVRSYAPQYELPEMDTLHVTVVPKGLVVAAAGRSVNQYDCQIDIAVQKRFQSDTPAELDPLLALAEEIADFFRLRRLSAFPAAAWIKTEHNPVFAPEHMRELHQFTGVVTLTYKVMK